MQKEGYAADNAELSKSQKMNLISPLIHFHSKRVDSFKGEILLLNGKKTVLAEPVEGFLNQPPSIWGASKDPSLVQVRLRWETGRPKFLFTHSRMSLN